MGEIKAGVIVATEFCRPESDKFQGYIDYIDRSEAIRNENTAKYNLYQNYMGNPEKTTGLFTNEKDTLTKKDKDELKNIFTKAQENESIMWQTVISFDNRWLKQHGIINEQGTLIDEAKLKEVARGGIRRMLESEGLENAVWSGAIHYNTDNLHIHIATVEPVPMREKKLYTQYDEVVKDGKKYKFPILDDKGEPVQKMEYKGRFKQSSIEKCKSYVVNELINDKENNIKINNIIRESIVRQKQEHPLSVDADFISKFEALYQRMPNCNKNLWNYNNPIMASLRESIDEISQLYINKYHANEFRELIERIAAQEEVYKEAYGNSGKDYASAKMKDLYARLGNTVLKEIKSYDKELNNLEKTQGVINAPQEENSQNDLGVQLDPLELNDEKVTNLSKSALNLNEIHTQYFDEYILENQKENIDEFVEPEADIEKAYYKWSDEYKKAKRLIHQKNPDYENAIQILISEHNAGNVLATYELGDIYKYGRGRAISAATSERYYANALQGFEYQYNKVSRNNPEYKGRKNSYLAYRIGKMYYYGQGTEADYTIAENLFALSDNQYAKYMLGKMAYNGQGMEKDYEIAFEYFNSVSKTNAYAAYKAASMIENGEINFAEDKEELYERAFSGFMSMEDKQEDDNLEYRIGMMYLNGKGVDEDQNKAIEYLEKSAEAKNTYAMNKLAQIYLKENNQDKIPDALKYLHEAATKGKNVMAMYTLGNVYSADEYGMKDMDEAVKWYKQAEENGNQFAAYKLGKLYLENKDIENAIMHLEKCDNKYASYTLGKIYYGRKDYSKAEQEFSKCSDENIEAYSKYYLGKIYLDKEGEMYNPKKGIDYMEQSAERGNTAAMVSLGIVYLKGESANKNSTLAKTWIERAANEGDEFAAQFLENMNKRRYYTYSNVRLGQMRAMILCNATQFLKKALKDEWEKRQNQREHEMLVSQEEEKE